MGRHSLRHGIRRLLAPALAVVAILGVPATALAHPLGNFTINHYAELRVAPDRIDIDLVIDMAEIPAFQERQTMDADGDGSVADNEAAAWATSACRTRAAELVLTRDGAAVTVDVDGAATPMVEFPAGAGGLSTLRLECRFVAALTPPLAGQTELTFADRSDRERIGWREILATGVGTILETHGLPATSPSRKLTAYPADLIAQPLDIRSATISARPDPAAAPATTAGSPTPSASSPAGAAIAPGGGGGAVPGGVASELPTIFRTADLTPWVILVSLVTAVFIGALHALTPGHGKTLMAAYLVGSRGTAIHAVGLGLSVAVSHTIGILALALVILGAGSALPPDVVYRVAPVIAGGSIIAIGGWMLVREIRRRVVTSDAGPDHHAEDLEHGHDHPHEDGHDHPHEHSHEHPHEHPPTDPASGLHSHGGVAHSHLPPAGSTLSWRGLFVLGLAGGLIPSTSALIILLGSIASGRPAFGLILVVAFGLGMAAVMSGVGLLMIAARSRLDRLPSATSLGRLALAAPLVASIAVLGLGIFLTFQAIAGAPVL